MKVYNTSFTLSTDEQTEISDITKLVRDAVQQFAVTTGIALVNTLHTTCALFVNEFQSALIDDLRSLIERLVPERDGYRHDDPRVSDCERGNAHSHLRAALLGRNIAVGVNSPSSSPSSTAPGSARSASRSSASSPRAYARASAPLAGGRARGVTSATIIRWGLSLGPPPDDERLRSGCSQSPNPITDRPSAGPINDRSLTNRIRICGLACIARGESGDNFLLDARGAPMFIC